jgi:Photosynthesis system II assembly factor YCF48/Putative zinc-finger
MDEMLRRTASRGAAASDPFGRCLDAEMLAAWIDGDLTAADVSAAEAHVSSCARCQAMVAAIVRSTPAAPALVPWWRRGWAIGALVPLTAGAVAVAMYVATPDVEQHSASAVATQQALPNVAPSQPEQRQRQPQQRQEQPPPPVAAVQPSATTPQADGNLARRRAAQAKTTSNGFRAAARAAETESAKKQAADTARRDEPAGASSRAPAAAPPAVPPAGVAPLEAAAAATLRDAAATPAPQRETVSARSLPLAKSAFVRPPTEVVSPDQSVRWRPGAAGTIQRSTDGGASWTTQSSGVAEDLTAGSAPSSSACWIVGRRGTVLLTADGVQWRRIAFPESVDLIGVQAVDLANATVTSADGRRFRTADGGQIWTRQ